MGWIIVAVAAAALVVVMWSARVAGRRLAHRVVRPRPRTATRIRASTPTSVTLDADRRTLHRGQFGLWFGTEGHAVVGPIRGRDPVAGTVTRELLHVSGDLGAAEVGYWRVSCIPGPKRSDGRSVKSRSRLPAARRPPG